MTLPVNEIFYTIQGEGGMAGRPSVFIRLQGCPVHCPWCDTKHTWSLGKDKEVSELEMLAKGGYIPRPTYAKMEFEDILGAMESLVFRPENPPLVVITGGEPLIHKEQLVDFINFLTSRSYEVQIETSGTISFTSLLYDCEVRPYITVSPKFGINDTLPVLIDELIYADEVKLVIGTELDIEAWEMAKEALQGKYLPPSIIYIQPNSAVAESTDLAIKLVKSEGYRLSLQTHKLVGIE